MVVVAFVAVVRTLSPSSAAKSRTECASDAIVSCDCVESLEAFEARLALVRFAAGLLVWLTRVKKEQSDERLKCSSLPRY